MPMPTWRVKVHRECDYVLDIKAETDLEAAALASEEVRLNRAKPMAIKIEAVDTTPAEQPT